MRRTIGIIALLTILAMVAVSVYAALDQPTPPNERLQVVSQSRRQYINPISIWAEAGNVSELSINTTTVTRGWAGFYGNISGTITLDDALNNTMYKWALLDPEGQIYASRETNIDWIDGNVECANITQIETEETRLNFNGRFGQDVDGINETFSVSTHPSFSVGNNTFTANQCGFVVSTYVNDVPDPNRAFNETLLWSGSDDGMIYMAFIIQGGNDGFKIGNDNYDFQMLVGEDGHNGDTSPVPYYFWVEIR